MPDTCGSDNAVCSNDSVGGTCICNTGYYDSNNVSAGGTCEPSKTFDGILFIQLLTLFAHAGYICI